MIAFEGPDNAGKSTLAKYVSEKYGLAYFTAGPAPKNEEELGLCLDEQYARSAYPIVQDRLTCISHKIYHWDFEFLDLEISRNMIRHSKRFMMVYCRPPDRILMDFSTHKLKSYDTEESIKKIVDNQHTYIERYDAIMAKIPHLTYDWTDDQMSKDMISDLLMATQYSENEWNRLQQQLAINGIQR
jgi:adenylate kinase family enzyme